MMGNIGEHLDKFKKFAAAKSREKNVIRGVLAEEGISVPPALIQARDKTIRLKVSGPAKTEAVLREKILLEKINRRLGGDIFTKIK